MGLNYWLERYAGVRLVRKGSQGLSPGTPASDFALINLGKPCFDFQAEAAPLLRICATRTMSSIERMMILYQICRWVELKDLPGDLVECGVWRGGSSGVMAGVHLAHGKRNRKLWLYDSFEGLPEPTTNDGKDGAEYAEGATGGALKSIEKCIAEEQWVLDLLKELSFPSSRVELVKGWFEETLVAKKPDTIAVLRLDGDWYRSTKICFDQLFDRVTPGGVIIIDDYGAWSGCKKAVDEFFLERGIQPFLHHIDGMARYFFKD